MYGSKKCARCPIPDKKGRALCPECRAPLYFITTRRDGYAVWACNSLKACGLAVSIPVGNVEREEQLSMSRQDRRREQVRQAVRRHRRQKPPSGEAEV